MLQSKIPNARILAFNYDSTWLSDAPSTRVELCGEELIQSLHRLRQESDRPIVFIAHSFGGLVVQDVSSVYFKFSASLIPKVSQWGLADICFRLFYMPIERSSITTFYNRLKDLFLSELPSEELKSNGLRIR